MVSSTFYVSLISIQCELLILEQLKVIGFGQLANEALIQLLYRLISLVETMTALQIFSPLKWTITTSNFEPNLKMPRKV